MALICNHPELAGKEAAEGTLPDDSEKEQSGAGLNQCSAEELSQLQSLNQTYHKKFEFPFVIAVSGLNKNQIFLYRSNRITSEKLSKGRIRNQHRGDWQDQYDSPK